MSAPVERRGEFPRQRLAAELLRLAHQAEQVARDRRAVGVLAEREHEAGGVADPPFGGAEEHRRGQRFGNVLLSFEVFGAGGFRKLDLDPGVRLPARHLQNFGDGLPRPLNRVAE